MRPGRAVAAGLLGALAMTALVAVFRLAGLTPMNLEMTLGTMLIPEPTRAAWFLGFGMHLCAGATFGLLYGVAMDLLQRWGPGIGLAMGAVHGLVTGLLMALMPLLHPSIPERFPAPGPYLVNLGGFEVLVYLGLHLLFGYVVGGIYGPPRRRAEPEVEELRARRPPTATLPR